MSAPTSETRHKRSDGDSRGATIGRLDEGPSQSFDPLAVSESWFASLTVVAEGLEILLIDLLNECTRLSAEEDCTIEVA